MKIPATRFHFFLLTNDTKQPGSADGERFHRGPSGLFWELAQNGSRPNHHPVGSVPFISGGADSALCAFQELAQNGSRLRRPNGEFLCSVAARDIALCASSAFFS